MEQKRTYFCELPCGPAMLSRRKLSGDPPETLRGGSPDFLAKSLANPDKIFKKNAKKNFFENFVWICQ